MLKKKYLLVSFLISTFSILYAQPYYYTSTYEPIPGLAKYNGDLYRINMSNPAVVESLMTNVYELTSIYSDEYGNWLVYEENFRLFIINPNNLNQKTMITDYCDRVKKFSYSASINKLILLFNSTMVLVDPASLTTTDSIPKVIYDDVLVAENINLSKNGDIMYIIQGDSILLKPKIASYSFSAQQIISTKFIDEISEFGADEFYFNYRRNGLSVIESLFLLPTPTSYYRIYFLDKDSLSIPIIRDDSQTWADGYVASEGDYLLLFNNLLNPDSLGFTYTGKIEIYDMTNSELKKIIQLPPGGEVMCFENYPNNVYYAIDIEEPTRQIYTLKMDSICNVLDLTSLDPTSAIVNSPPFTLTVFGHGFDTLSTVFFNENAKTTTYVSDSVLTAEISTSDISTVGDYPVWVTDQWATSDTLIFSVVPHSPVLTSISPEAAYFYPNADMSDFTVTAYGEFFTDSSVVYFNGNAKTTTYVSDSVLTFQIHITTDIPGMGNYPVWVSNYGSDSDTLIFSKVSSLPQSVAPVVECVHDNGDHTYTAYFSYNNNNSVSVYIPLGSKNYVQTILLPDRGQPKVFLVGLHTSVFNASFPGTSSLTWFLHQAGVTASRTSTPCP